MLQGASNYVIVRWGGVKLAERFLISRVNDFSWFLISREHGNWNSLKNEEHSSLKCMSDRLSCR